MKRVTRLGGDVKKKSTAKVLRVAAYCRVSTGSDAQLESLDAQKTHYENYINGREDWEFAGLYFDEGISGTNTKKRSEFKRMIACAKEGDFDLIITKEISRFARNTLDSIYYTRDLKKHGVGVIFMNDNINTRPAQEPEINEVDGEPIFHADEEEGEDHE